MIAKHRRMFGRPIGQFEDRMIFRHFYIVKRDTITTLLVFARERSTSVWCWRALVRQRAYDVVASSTAHASASRKDGVVQVKYTNPDTVLHGSVS